MSTCTRCHRPHRSKRVICFQCRRYMQHGKPRQEQIKLGRFVGEYLVERIWRVM
jgi:hypothetical protein